MTRAVDPFEEFLRKKKVEMLEEKVRKGPEAPAQPAEAAEGDETADPWAPSEERSEQEVDQQLSDEMAEFFERGAGAGAELFAQAQEIEEDRVDEIKDALEDVFEAEDTGPEVVDEEDDTFIDFFKEVQTSFDPDLADLRREQDLAREIVQPVAEEGAFEDEPLTAEFPVPEAPSPEAVTDTAPLVEPELEPEPAPEPEAPNTSSHPGAPDPLRLEPEQAAAVESAALVLDEAAEVDDAASTVERLELAEILAPLQEGEDLRRRVDVLSRLVVKLVERSDVSESEIVEVLIKSGVGF